ncbi:MAG: LemA family protein [Pseudomonadota bacterium]
MARKSIIVLVALAVLVLGGFISVSGTYNRLVVLDEGVKASWAQVENQLKRRFDLIPNLVQTVKGYARHEREVLVEVTSARAKVGQAATVPEKMSANATLGTALSRLLLVVERYPDLKANQNFIRLQDELAGTENRISVERRRYNEAVQAYNISLRRFPTNLLAGSFGFRQATFFDAPPAADTAPAVKF